jgi:hypothetical protein
MPLSEPESVAKPEEAPVASCVGPGSELVAPWPCAGTVAGSRRRSLTQGGRGSVLSPSPDSELADQSGENWFASTVLRYLLAIKATTVVCRVSPAPGPAHRAGLPAHPGPQPRPRPRPHWHWHCQTRRSTGRMQVALRLGVPTGSTHWHWQLAAAGCHCQCRCQRSRRRWPLALSGSATVAAAPARAPDRGDWASDLDSDSEPGPARGCPVPDVRSASVRPRCPRVRLSLRLSGTCVHSRRGWAGSESAGRRTSPSPDAARRGSPARLLPPPSASGHRKGRASTGMPVGAPASQAQC